MKADLPELETIPVTEMPEELAAERMELREQQRRSHLALRGRPARRSSVLKGAGVEYVSKQPDVGRAVRRAAGIRFSVGLGNEPYRREEPKRLSKKARRKGGVL